MLSAKSPRRTVWVIRAGRRGRDSSAFESAGIVGLALPAVAGLETMTRDDALQAVQSALAPEDHTFASARDFTFAAILWRFIHDVEGGDGVLTSDAAAAEVLAGIVDGPYRFSPDPDVPGYHHVRPVTWVGRVRRGDLPQQVRRSIGARAPVYLPAAQEQIAALQIWRDVS